MKKFQKIFFCIGLVTLLSLLSACGRYSDPLPVEGSGFPHNYPAN